MLNRATPVLFLLAASLAAAQTVKEKLDLSREAVEGQRRILVAGSVPMSDAEADAFWPLFDAWERDRRPLDARANQLVADFLAAGAGLSDAQAKAMVDEGLKIEEARVKLRRSYMDRMAKAIPPRKLARFYQVENKLDAAVRAGIAKQIPLAP